MSDATELQQLYAAFEGSGHSPKNPREAAQAIATMADYGRELASLRALIAGIATPDTKCLACEINRRVLVDYRGAVDRADTNEERVAELEAELRDCAKRLGEAIELAEERLAHAHRETADLATVTRELDEAKTQLVYARAAAIAPVDHQEPPDGHEIELAERDARIGELEAHVSRLQDHLADYESDEDSRTEQVDSLTRELAEAKEELKLVGAALLTHGPNNGLTLWAGDYGLTVNDAENGTRTIAYERTAAGVVKALLGAHRAKTSGAADKAAGSSQSSKDAAAPELPYETRPTLEPGVRYRVVEASSNAELVDGHEFVASGEEWIGDSECLAQASTVVRAPFAGWYAIPRELGSAATVPGWYRVVRVEPEKAPKREECPHGVGLCTASCPSKRPHDGGGERLGLGPHAATVADLVRRVERLEDALTTSFIEEIRAERAGRCK